jgi:hypothetical protein
MSWLGSGSLLTGPQSGSGPLGHSFSNTAVAPSRRTANTNAERGFMSYANAAAKEPKNLHEYLRSQVMENLLVTQ